MNTLYLTEKEQKLFSALPGEKKSGWNTEVESCVIIDTEEQRMIRLHLLRVHSATAQSLADHLRSAGDAAAMIQIAKGADLSLLSEEDLQQIFFAVGPVIITRILGEVLFSVRNDEDIEFVAALSLVRHAILSSCASL